MDIKKVLTLTHEIVVKIAELIPYEMCRKGRMGRT